MPDIGEKATEREYKRLRAKIKDIYQQAYEEIYQKNLDFVRRHEQKERQYRQMVAEGRISQADFDAWMRGQVFQGRMWEAQRKQMQETLYHADEIALQMVNDSRYSVFADNANYIGYTLEKGARVMTSFGLYDADSVRRLLKEEPYLLPPRKLAGRDKSYQWYNRQIQTAITQGIIQGEPLKDIAKRIGQQTGETDMNAMLRNARTMQTGAQNAGRIEGMHQAQRLGINVKKQWMATLDSHTRDAHQALDGQIAEVDKPFKSELGPIMYPGDQAANPANVWNCRCTLVSVYPEYPDEMMKRRDNETGEIIDNMTYREWEEMKRSRRAEPEQGNTVVDGKDISETWERRPDQFDYEIEDIINEQGFDGLPRVVGDDEFEQAMQDSGLYMQRVYSAESKEILEAYRNDLYNGEFHVDCAVGGADFGQGMYASGDFTLKQIDSVIEDSQRYVKISENRGFEYSYIEKMTMRSDARVISYDDLLKEYYADTLQRQSSITNTIGHKLVDDYVRSNGLDEADRNYMVWGLRISKDVEPFDLTSAQAYTGDKKKIGELRKEIENAIISAKKKDPVIGANGDMGIYGALKGYDAIDVRGQAANGTSQVVILNRTKVIINGG